MRDKCLFSFRQLIYCDILAFRKQSSHLSHSIEDHTMLLRIRREVHVPSCIKYTSSSMLHSYFPHLCRHPSAQYLHISNQWLECLPFRTLVNQRSALLLYNDNDSPIEPNQASDSNRMGCLHQCINLLPWRFLIW